MAENPLKNRLRKQSSAHQRSPTPTPPKLEEEEVVWGKTPDGEGKLQIIHHIVSVAD